MRKAVRIYVQALMLLTCRSFSQDSTSIQSPLHHETMATVAKVESTNNYAGNFDPDSAATLPFGIVKEIGVTRYIIAIDSAMFAPGKANFNAFMALEFPGSTDRIAFAAKNVAFNPKGVIPGNNTRLVLVSEHKIHIGPNLTLVLPDDGSNYVEWDCNGFKGVKLKGYFEFGKNILIPDSTSGSTSVKASFDVYTNDVHNFMAQVSISPFCIKGLKDVSFYVSDASVDMSDFTNPTGMVFPPGYNGGAFGSQTSLWTGFYMKQLKIKLPKELSKNDKAVEIAATNFLIDKSGLSGNFSATNLFSTSEGKMGNWGFSIDLVGLSFISNNLVGGTLGGKILLPANETNGLSYTATVFQNLQTQRTDYVFSLSPASNYTATVLSAKLDIYPTSKLIVQKINGAFHPSVELNGKITFRHNYLETAKLEMQQVCVKDVPPYLTSGLFSFTDSLGKDSSKLSGFHISINSISISQAQNAPVIGFGVGIGLTAKNDNAFGAQASFAVVTKIETIVPVSGGNATTNNKKWSFDKVVVNDIGVSVHTNAFKFDGLLKFRNNDPQYGNGFFGSLTLSIEKILPNPVSANAWFGSVNNYNYYYFDLAVPATVVLIPPGVSPQGLAIYRFMGGLFYHMRPAANNQNATLYTSAFGNPQNYIPDVTKGVGIKAGVTLGAYPKNETFNGDVALEVLFTSSGGLGTIKFAGNGYMLVNINDRVPTLKTTPPVKVAFSLIYDHQNELTHALLNSKVTLPAVSAQGQTELHIDKTTWYVNFGKPYNRVLVNLAGLASIDAYIMMGNVLEPIPPPPSQVMDKFGHGVADTRDVNKVSNGNGLVLGASMGAGSSGGFGWDGFNVYYNLGMIAGFDVMAINYGTNAHCSGATGRAGFNGWYAQGNVYAALWGEIGAKGKLFGSDFDVQLVSVSAAAMLGGKFPNPSHVRGDIAVNYDFLHFFRGQFNCGFEAGNACNITN